MRYKGMVIRPPSEAYSYILQITYGCSHNRCTFCATYKNTKFQIRDEAEVFEDIDMASARYPGMDKVFLADGNAMCLSTRRLERVLVKLNESFPRLQRVGVYANSRDILHKSVDELKRLKELKLGIAYIGLESGSEVVLERVKKGARPERMIEASLLSKEAGISTSVIVLLGLGGKRYSRIHAEESAKVAVAMKPSYLSALMLMLIPGTELHRELSSGDFEELNQLELLIELRNLIDGTSGMKDCVFRTNHASNYLPLKGILDTDRQKLLDTVDYGIAHPEIMRSEQMRGL